MNTVANNQYPYTADTADNREDVGLNDSYPHRVDRGWHRISAEYATMVPVEPYKGDKAAIPQDYSQTVGAHMGPVAVGKVVGGQ